MSELIGQQIGPYEIRSVIGQGGMATVYRAYQTSLNRYVAVKVLPAWMAQDDQFVQRFRQEALAAGGLRHPNILHIYDAGTFEGRHYIVMDYVPTGTLADRLRSGPLSPPVAVDLATQVADALEHMHRRGVVHRDLKPTNILIDEDGRPLLADFGIAQAVSTGPRLTQTGVSIGTPEYMSPEQAQGARVDGRSDIYSLGVVLYQMLTGRVPFHAPTPVGTVYQVVHEPPLPVRQANPAVLPQLEKVVLRALAKRPEARYQNAREMADALRQLRSVVSPAALAPATAPTRVAPVALATGFVAQARQVGTQARRTGAQWIGELAGKRPGLLPVLAGVVGFVVLVLVAMAASSVFKSGERPTLTPVSAVLPATTEVSMVTVPPTKPPTPVPTATRTKAVAKPPEAQTPAQPTKTPVPVTPTATPSGPYPAVVAGTDPLRVRNGPGTGYFVLGSLDAGTSVTVVGRTADNTWLAIEPVSGQRGWAAGQYLQAGAPPEAVAIIPTPSLPKSIQVAQAKEDFASQQGCRDWFYLISNSPGALNFQQMPWDSSTGKWYRWANDSRYNPSMRLSNNGGYPSRQHDVARLWISPYEGTLRISGRAYKEAGAGCGGDGVYVRIVQNKTDVWGHALGRCDTTGVSFDITLPTQVGDEFYFIINAYGNDDKDNTVFEPTIILQHPNGTDQPRPTRWPEPKCAIERPTPRPTAPPICFEPRLRHFEEHKGCCAEVAGLVYNRQQQIFGPAGAVVRIEGPPATNQYVREFGVDARGGGYNITALSVDVYTIWLKGPNIRSRKYEVRYADLARIRAIVDFYQVACW